MAVSEISAHAQLCNAISDEASHILVIDDDSRIRGLIGKYLVENGFRVTLAESSDVARAAMRGLIFDLLVLDVTMPGDDGIVLAKEIRQSSDIPIIMLTARSEPEERIKGLETGVDDYVPKPCEPRELLLRINNVLRRAELKNDEAGELQMGSFVFHIARGELKKEGKSVKLTERERDLLRLFAQRPGSPIPRHELATSGANGSERAVDVQINRLRRKLEADPSNPVYLQTVRGKGYILHAE